MLGKLSQVGRNSDILLDHLREETYKRLVDLLTVQDIQLIVHTLEALYKLSKVGEPFTTKIARVHKAISKGYLLVYCFFYIDLLCVHIYVWNHKM